jgi:hypothetical protein
MLNGTSTAGTISADHFHYLPIGAPSDVTAQADFALLHLTQPVASPTGSGSFTIDVNYGDLNVYGAPISRLGHGSDATIIGYPTSQGGTTLVSVSWPGVTHAPYTSTLDYTGPHLDPSFRGAPIVTNSTSPFLDELPGLATAGGALAVISRPMNTIINSWLAADQSGTPQPSGGSATPVPALLHSITFDTGAAGVNPAEAVLVDSFTYKVNNPDVAAAGMDPAQHFALYGWHENRAADPLFDVNYYLAHNPDVAASGMDPLLHYALFGWHEGRDPSAAFSTKTYLAANPDVFAANVDPLQHYLYYGINEFRTGTPTG